MTNHKIEKLDIKDYEKCNNIWDMSKCEFTEKFRQEIKNGNRTTFIYKINEEFIGEIAYVLDMQDSDYTIPNKRIYISRLIVKPTHRNQGIGGILIDFILKEIKKLGYTEATIGVDKDNLTALHLYKSKGFNHIIFDGKDEYGEFYKLMKIL
jgi:ribosomal protein S18 acetylase RimI-like enzyme